MKPAIYAALRLVAMEGDEGQRRLAMPRLSGRSLISMVSTILLDAIKDPYLIDRLGPDGTRVLVLGAIAAAVEPREEIECDPAQSARLGAVLRRGHDLGFSPREMAEAANMSPDDVLDSLIP